MPMTDISMEQQDEPEIGAPVLTPQDDTDAMVVSESAEATLALPGIDSFAPDCFPAPENDPSYAMLTDLPYTDIPASVSLPSTIGVCGLHNLGNTCFLNAGLQCLFSNPQIIHYFLTEFEASGDNSGEAGGDGGGENDESGAAAGASVNNCWDTLAGRFAGLLEKVWSGQYTVLHPSEFKNLLSIYHPQFKDFRQHDCQELLALLLDTLHEQLNKSTSGVQLSGFIPSSPEPAAILPSTNSSAPQELQSNPEEAAMGPSSAPDVIPKQAPLNNQVLAPRVIPTLEDLYMKDTKTLNTNVLAADDDDYDGANGGERRVVDSSRKYQKPDNLDHHQREADEDEEEEVQGLLLLQREPLEEEEELLMYEGAKGDGGGGEGEEGEEQAAKGAPSTSKPVKDTNLLVNHKPHKPAELYSKKFLFSELSGDEDYSINNIKRIKIDEEKNVRVQQAHKENITPTASTVAASTSSPQLPLPAANNEQQMLSRYCQNADKAWQKYLSNNTSVVVQTFQGQFKSTVVCQECHHMSVTFEPFMYLSVPIPHAMERQISVMFVPCDNRPPVRYLLTLHKQDKIQRLRQGLMTHIAEETADLIIAEVFNNHISRLLDDSTLLRFVNDHNRTVYAFEMIPPPAIEDDMDTAPQEQGGTSDSLDTITPNNLLPSLDARSPNSLKPEAVAPNNLQSETSAPNNLQSESTTPNNLLPESLVPNNLLSGFDTAVSNKTSLESNSVESMNNQDASSAESGSSDALNNLEANHDNIQDVANNLSSSSEVNPSLTDSFIDNKNAWVGAGENNAGAAAGSWAGGSAGAGDVGAASASAGSSAMGAGMGTTEKEENAVSASGTDAWKSCAICLEDMLDSDLMLHAPCGGMLCHTCLEMSFKHYGDAAGFICPVCSTTVKPEEDFVKMDGVADYKPQTRMLSVPVVQRYQKEEDGAWQLFGHPNILYLPSNMSGEKLYETVDRVVPILANYSIVLTDGEGYHCSRCLYTSHCSGCEVGREEEEVRLQPNDHLAIMYTVSSLSEDQLVAAGNHTDHPSMAMLRTDQPTTLYDCFGAFTQSEVLDEHNPWYCPQCSRNQCANKAMTVWRYPNTLVVYLKRFVFHELSSTKVDSKVEFPVTGLDLSDYISGPCDDNLLYDLTSCVCHFGSVNSGHYTAYARHCVNGDWYYYNDETTTQKTPGADDFANAYILFYQKQGTKVDLSLPAQIHFIPSSQAADQSGNSSQTTTQSASMTQESAAASGQSEAMTLGATDQSEAMTLGATDQSEAMTHPLEEITAPSFDAGLMWPDEVKDHTTMDFYS